jgi:hypothetical protein
MRPSVVITTPYPTPEDIAETYGIPKREAKELRKIIEESLAKSAYFRKNARGSTSNTNGSSRKRTGRASRSGRAKAAKRGKAKKAR